MEFTRFIQDGTDKRILVQLEVDVNCHCFLPFICCVTRHTTFGLRSALTMVSLKFLCLCSNVCIYHFHVTGYCYLFRVIMFVVGNGEETDR